MHLNYGAKNAQHLAAQQNRGALKTLAALIKFEKRKQ